MTSAGAARSPRDRLARTVPYLTFVLTGVVTTLLGPILPWLSARWSLTDEQAGAFFTIQFASSLVAGFSSSLVAARLGERRTISLGLACMALGVSGVGGAARSLAFVGVALCGIGIGLTVPTTNILVARTFRAVAAAALSALNLAWGAGAAVWPLVVAGVPATGSVVFALGLVLLGASALALLSREPTGPQSGPASVDEPTDVGWRRWVFFAVFFFLYGGSEAAIGGWMTEFARRLDPGAPAAVAASSFWGGLTIGRAAVAALVRDAREGRVALAGAGVAIVALTVVTLASDWRMAAVAAALAGCGLAPLFPITVAVLSRSNASRGAGPLISTAAVGGAILPWLVGVLSTQTGSLRVGLLVPLAGCVGLAAVHGTFWSRHRQKAAL